MRFDLPQDKKWVHDIEVPVRWGDMDAMGHVNNTLYFRYLEIARIDWMHGLGATINPSGEGLVIINAFCNFLRQISYPATLRVRTYVGQVGRTSFDTWHEMAHTHSPDEVCATGGATVVWANMVTEQSVPLPDFVRAHLGA